MSRITAAIAGELAAGVEDVMAQAGAVITGDQGNYIANGQPESIYGQIQQAAARQACRRYADDPGQFSGVAAIAVERACRPYLDDIGYGSPPTIAPEYRGGRCPGALTVSYETRSRTSVNFNCAEFGPWTAETTLIPSSPPPQGPILGVDTVITEIPLSNGADRTIRYRVRASNGEYSLNLGGVATRTWFSGCGVSREFRNLRFAPVGGTSDDCPPDAPDILPPVPPALPGRPKERFNPRPGIDVDIEVTIDGPQINIDFGTGPITIDPFSPRDPGDPGDPGGPAGPPPGDVGEPGGPVEVPPGGEAEGEAPPGSVLTGLKVDILDGDELLRPYTDVVRRGVGYFYMGVPGLLDQDFGGSMIRSGQFLLAEKDNLTAWRAAARVGVTLRVTPYYRQVE